MPTGTSKRFQKLNTGDPGEFSFKDKETGIIYVFETQEEAFTKIAELSLTEEGKAVTE